MASVQLRRRAAGRQDPLSREALFRQVGALVGAVLLGFLSLAIREVSAERTDLLVQASVVTAVVVVATLVVPWHRLPFVFHSVMPFVLLAVAHLAREATGGADSGYAQVALLPVLWVAVYGSRLELAGMIAAAGALVLLPFLEGLSGDREVVGTLAMLGGASVVALVVHRFFNQIRHQTNRLQVYAGTDPLTGAANRRSWDEQLSAGLLHAVRDQMPLSIALIDLDDFKGYNDQHGHQAGDRLLKEAVAGWRSILRTSDILARIGGDEFAVLLPGCGLEMAASIADRLRASVPASIRCSIGVSVWDGREAGPVFVARADRALYDAKEQGRDRVVVIGDDDDHRVEVWEDLPAREREELG